jgi:hypothetical protein
LEQIVCGGSTWSPQNLKFNKKTIIDCKNKFENLKDIKNLYTIKIYSELKYDSYLQYFCFQDITGFYYLQVSEMFSKACR